MKNSTGGADPERSSPMVGERRNSTRAGGILNENFITFNNFILILTLIAESL